MYELKKLLDFANKKLHAGKPMVLASIIKTIGSSYRKKGTQMIISEDLEYEGALSGGCVENEVLRQSEKVFTNKENVIFEYDGQYKLGCKGKIYVLIEYLENSTLQQLILQFNDHHQKRKGIILGIKKDNALSGACTYYSFESEKIEISQPNSSHDYSESEELDIPPQNQLVIIGGEYDSVSLAKLADAIGFKTYLIVKESFSHLIPDSVKVLYAKPEELTLKIKFDNQTAVVLMTHSLSKDLNYLIEMLKVESKYLGVLGPPSRREIIMNNLLEYNQSLLLEYSDKLEKLYGPIGLNIGAKTPEEISISVLSEIISVFNHQLVTLSLDH
mgnify:CR=1 FL=1